MDGGAPLNRFQCQRSNHGVHAAAVAGGSNGDTAPACTIREQDRLMPIANVIRIIRKVLPTHAKISDNTKETIQECTSKFISFITNEANEQCHREQRKTITGEDILWAMSKLGFDEYIRPLTVYLHHHRELDDGHRGSLRVDLLAPLPIRQAPSQLPSDPTMFIQTPLPPLPFHISQQQQQQQQQMGMRGYYTYGGDGSESERG